jgi:hypothetical protein
VLGWPRSGAKAYPIYDNIAAILYGL